MRKIMNSKKMWVALIIIFISGIIIGLVSGLAINRRRPSFGFSNTGRFRNRIISNITRQLKLNEKQHAQTEKIINAMAEQIRNYQAEQRPKIKAVIDKSMSDIEKLLTPEQLGKFIEMRAKIAKQHRARRHGREWREHQSRGNTPRKRLRGGSGNMNGRCTQISVNPLSTQGSSGPVSLSNSQNSSGPVSSSNSPNSSGPASSSNSQNPSGPVKSSVKIDSLGPPQ